MTLLDDMNRQGWHPTASLLPEMVQNATDFLIHCNVYPGCHVQYSAGPASSWIDCLDAKVLCWSMKDAILCPNLFEYALTRIFYVQEWLGEEPLLYSVNAFCTRPGGPSRPDIQEFHQDRDDVKFLPLFIALTDGIEQEIRMPDGQISLIQADAGDAFFSNTMLPHRGLLPKKERIIFWARWGVSDPPASYVWDKLQPVDKKLLGDRYPTDPQLQRMIRLVVC